MDYWYYDKEALLKTPSIQDGIDYNTENKYRKEGARFIVDMGTAMDLPYNTWATGVVFFHRFYMFQSFMTFPRYVTACCCLFLAGKVEETPKKCKDIIRVAQSLLSEDKFVTFGEDPKEEVMTLERIIMQTIKFDLKVQHPYYYLTRYAKCLKGDKSKLQKMVQMAWTFINDSLSTTLCIQWEPEIVAIALMYLAAKLSKFKVINWANKKPNQTRWWDMYVQDLSMDVLEDICHQVLDLYSPVGNEEIKPENHPLHTAIKSEPSDSKLQVAMKSEPLDSKLQIAVQSEPSDSKLLIAMKSKASDSKLHIDLKFEPSDSKLQVAVKSEPSDETDQPLLTESGITCIPSTILLQPKLELESTIANSILPEVSQRTSSCPSMSPSSVVSGNAIYSPSCPLPDLFVPPPIFNPATFLNNQETSNNDQGFENFKIDPWKCNPGFGNFDANDRSLLSIKNAQREEFQRSYSFPGDFRGDFQGNAFLEKSSYFQRNVYAENLKGEFQRNACWDIPINSNFEKDANRGMLIEDFSKKVYSENLKGEFPNKAYSENSKGEFPNNAYSENMKNDFHRNACWNVPSNNFEKDAKRGILSDDFPSKVYPENVKGGEFSNAAYPENLKNEFPSKAYSENSNNEFQRIDCWVNPNNNLEKDAKPEKLNDDFPNKVYSENSINEFPINANSESVKSDVLSNPCWDNSNYNFEKDAKRQNLNDGFQNNGANLENSHDNFRNKDNPENVYNFTRNDYPGNFNAQFQNKDYPGSMNDDFQYNAYLENLNKNFRNNAYRDNWNDSFQNNAYRGNWDDEYQNNAYTQNWNNDFRRNAPGCFRNRRRFHR